MNNLISTILSAIENNQRAKDQINSNTTTKNYYDTIRSGDASRGEALANQIMQNYGLTKEQAIQQAQNGLQQMFGGLFGQK